MTITTACGSASVVRRRWRTSTSARRSSTSTTSGSPSASSTPRGYGAKGYFENYKSLKRYTRADLFQRPGERTEVFVRFSTVAGNKGSVDLARDVRGFAVKLYTKEGNWDLVGNNIPVFFIQDAIALPRSDPRREAGARSWLPAGADGARQLLGLRLADAGVHAHVDVGDERPGDPALVPLHGGLRRAHVPVRQRQGRVDVRQVPLEAQARPAVGAVGRGVEDQRRRPRLPPPRPVDGDRAGFAAGVGAVACSCSTTSSPTASTSTCSTRPSSSPRRSSRCARSGGWCWTGSSTTSSPRPSRSRSARRTSCPASTSPTTRCCRVATSPISTRS